MGKEEIETYAAFIPVFDCPIHGLEIKAFCWRAFQDENLHLWSKGTITLHPISLDVARRWTEAMRETDGVPYPYGIPKEKD